MGGPEHLLDANVDWGQDLLYLKRWLAANSSEAENLKLAYFGFVNPGDVGLHHDPVPAGPGPEDRSKRPAAETGPLPGWYAVSVNHVYGYRHYGGDGAPYPYFLRFRPVATAGYSIYFYHIDLEQANAVRSEFGLPDVEAHPPAM